MISTRKNTVNDIASAPATPIKPATPANIDYFGEDVFNARAMRNYLSKETCEKLLATIDEGAPLDANIASEVAHAMKRWALDRGATHFTHWFQPLTGSTAEKHDSFLELEEGKPIMACAPLSRPADTPPGTPLAPLLSSATATARPFVFPRHSAAIPARPWTRRRPCSAACRPFPSLPAGS